MNDKIKEYKKRLDLLDHLLSKNKTNHPRIKALKRNVAVLRKLLEKDIPPIYVRGTSITLFSKQ